MYISLRSFMDRRGGPRAYMNDIIGVDFIIKKQNKKNKTAPNNLNYRKKNKE